jgi:hypothetical protein
VLSFPSNIKVSLFKAAKMQCLSNLEAEFAAPAHASVHWHFLCIFDGLNTGLEAKARWAIGLLMLCHIPTHTPPPPFLPPHVGRPLLPNVVHIPGATSAELPLSAGRVWCSLDKERAVT